MKLMPIILIVLSGVFYHLTQKLMPLNANPIAALIITYITATIISVVSYFVFFPGSDLSSLFIDAGASGKLGILLGFAVVGLELGFLSAYRLGWNISAASLLSNTLVVLILIPVGFLLFRESISQNAIIGIIMCITGLIFIAR